jgi:hypothetical protein
MWVLARGTHDGICIFSGIPFALFRNHRFESLEQSQIREAPELLSIIPYGQEPSDGLLKTFQ